MGTFTRVEHFSDEPGEMVNLNRVDSGNMRRMNQFENCQNVIINYDNLDELKVSNIDQLLLHQASNMTYLDQNVIDRSSKIIKDTLGNKGGKVADKIKLVNCGAVYVGNRISIVEQVVLKAETKPEPTNIKASSEETIVLRKSWFARLPVAKPDQLKSPAKYVIIAHTATYEYRTQIENVNAMQTIQNFHMDSMGWADVGYNFCIGSDGNAYEGRGWLCRGSHTLGYNSCSVGIAFIGCFLSELPPKIALDRCKKLITHGVQIGAISRDYELIAQCQCRPFLSPGLKLYQEIATWEHFNPSIKNTDPCLYA